MDTKFGSLNFNLKKIFLSIIFLIFLILFAAFLLVLNPGSTDRSQRERHIFAQFSPDLIGLPDLQRFQARDGDWLSYRVYNTKNSFNNNKILILLHGSSGHGEYLNYLARHLSGNDICKVYVPNLRGHYLSGRHRGDCEYIGQIEDDIVDLINKFEKDNKNIFLGGHSLGGGLAIRFAGSKYNDVIKGYVLLAPAIPNSAVLKNNNAGGWANLHKLRNIGLVIFNFFGITGLNSLPILDFNKPGLTWTGKETLTYSYRLMHSLMPRIFDLKKDFAGLKNKFILLVGSEDEAGNPDKYSDVIRDAGDAIRILPCLNHRDIIQDPEAVEIIGDWISER